jgi:cell division protein FtsZ
VQKAAAENANIIFGAVLNEAMGDAVKVTVIATGVKSEKMGIKPLTGPSMAIRTAQQSVRTALARKEKLPVEQTPAEMSAEIPEDDYDVPTFIRQRKAEAK